MEPERFKELFKLQNSDAYSDTHIRQLVYGIPNSEAGRTGITSEVYYVDGPNFWSRRKG